MFVPTPEDVDGCVKSVMVFAIGFILLVAFVAFELGRATH